jgi:hypothetical protein
MDRSSGISKFSVGSYYCNLSEISIVIGNDVMTVVLLLLLMMMMAMTTFTLLKATN